MNGKAVSWRLPYAPLEEAACGGQPRHTDGSCTRCNRSGRPDAMELNAVCVTDADLAQRLGCSRRTLARYRAAQHIDGWTADRMATALGHHPSEIWGLAWLGSTLRALIELEAS
jgi:hypothetical protein